MENPRDCRRPLRRLKRPPRRSAAGGGRLPARPPKTVYWVAGMGFQDAKGRLHIPIPLAVGHEPSRVMYRAWKASRLRGTVYAAPKAVNEICLMPVRDRDAQKLAAELQKRATRASAPLARAARIGLGQEGTTEREPVPMELQTTQTEPDGTLAEPMKENAFAIREGPGFKGAIDAGRPRNLRDAQLEREMPPQYAAGLGIRRDIKLPAESGRHPQIQLVLAVATTPETAARRAAWKVKNDPALHNMMFGKTKGMIALKVAAIRASDAALYEDNARELTARNPEVEALEVRARAEGDEIGNIAEYLGLPQGNESKMPRAATNEDCSEINKDENGMLTVW